MSGPNGPDIAAVYQLLTQVARTVAGLSETVAGHDRKLDYIRAHLEAHDRVLAEHDRKLDDLAAGLVSLRETVTHYHSTVVGHGVLYGELEDPVRRIERHLRLESAGD
jgi:ABC-type transporter Mla subunit MlaD